MACQGPNLHSRFYAAAGFGGFWKNSVQSCLARARYRYGARLLAAARWNRAIPARIVRGIPETTISDHKLIRT